MLIEISIEKMRELNKKNISLNYVIGKGSQDKYFTLWTCEITGTIGKNTQCYFSYVKNISVDMDKAIESFKNQFESDPLYFPFLTGNTEKYQSIINIQGIFQSGKYKGCYIEEVPKDYIRFLINNNIGGALLEKLSKEILKENDNEIEIPLNFGKYKGLTLKEISKIDSKYLFWLIENCQSLYIPNVYMDIYINIQEKYTMSYSKYNKTNMIKDFTRQILKNV